MRFSLLEILEVTGGGEGGGTQVGEMFSTFHTDSREVKPGGLFFALRGAEMDGHEFVSDAVARGAAAIVVERKTDTSPGIVEIVVPDSWAALYALAAHALRRVQPLVVAVTGSNGKTSTKEMVAAILAQHFNVLRTQGNLNTETGVPLTILNLEPHHSALVLEMGMQRAGSPACRWPRARRRSARSQSSTGSRRRPPRPDSRSSTTPTTRARNRCSPPSIRLRSSHERDASSLCSGRCASSDRNRTRPTVESVSGRPRCSTRFVSSMARTRVRWLKRAAARWWPTAPRPPSGSGETRPPATVCWSRRRTACDSISWSKS